MAPLQVEQDHFHDDAIDYSTSSAFSSSNSSLMSATNIPTIDDSKDKQVVTTKQKKTVRFSTYSELYYIPNLEDYDRRDLAKAYLSQKDRERIAIENQYTLSAMNQGIYPDSDDEYFRGLEGGIHWFSIYRKDLVRATVLAVLREQKARGSVLDASWVQHYYSALTAPSVLNALRVGIWDAHVTRTIFEEETR